MIHLLIADDEPLVQAGIKSMLNWEEYNISIVGTARNGAIAYDIITEHSPEIVITDIKMPVMSGLELAKKCNEEGRTLPLFIFLTSYEDFHFVKEAISYQAIDYLVKMELTSDILAKTLKRAIDKVTELNKYTNSVDSTLGNIYLLKEQFYTRLILNLFESENQFKIQSQNLNINLEYPAYAACYVEILSDKLNEMPPDRRLNLYTSSLSMARELTAKYVSCHVLSLDTKHFAIIFFLDDNTTKAYKSLVHNALEQVSMMLFNYFSVSVLASVGAIAYSPMQIASSFHDAKQIFSQLSLHNPIIFMEDSCCDMPLKNVFNMSLWKEDIRKAYVEYNDKALYDIFTQVIKIFKDHNGHYVQALDAAGNILYLSLSLLNNGEQIVSKIFLNYKNGYRSLYELTSVPMILDWLTIFRDGLCNFFIEHNKDHKNHIVNHVKKYITEHVEERLTLNKVAEVFNISPSYLSVLFSKYNNLGFTDYIIQSKIEAAIRIMQKGDLKIYEISETLGFESAFYFSRVFKKVTGVTPRDYLNQRGYSG